MMNILNKKNLNNYSEQYHKNKKNNILKNALTYNPVDKVLINREVLKNRNNTFTKLVSQHTFITNQKKSGRCWLFSFLNLLRFKMIHRYGLNEDFQLSQNYLFFYDKLEKSNYFLNVMYESKNENITSQKLRYFLNEPIGDGGYWKSAVNLIEKYGVVPGKNMHETYQSNNTEKLNYFLTTNLRRFASKIRKSNFNKEQFDNFLKDKMYTIYRLLVYFLGTPPENFNWIYNKIEKGKKKQIQINDLTPLLFYKKYVKFNPNDYVPLFNFPIKKYPFYKKYKLVYCNNMSGLDDPIITNIPMKEMGKIVKNSIDGNSPVWFGADIDKYFERQLGIANREIYDFSHLDDPDDGEMTKGERILTYQSKPTHAMLFIGYNIDADNKVDRWLIENSWGANNENEGFLNMANNWFNNYVYEIVVEKKYLTKELKTKINNKDIEEILPWELFPCDAT